MLLHTNAVVRNFGAGNTSTADSLLEEHGERKRRSQKRSKQAGIPIQYCVSDRRKENDGLTTKVNE